MRRWGAVLVLRGGRGAERSKGEERRGEERKGGVGGEYFSMAGGDGDSHGEWKMDKGTVR
jgi:hypothetical protein